MTRVLTWIVVGVVVIGIGIVGVFYFRGGALIKAGVEEYAPPIVGTSVALDGASLQPFSGEASLTGFVVGSPAGFTADRSFSLGEVFVKLDPRSLTTDHVLIDEIRIDQPELTVEVTPKGTNIQALQKNIEAATGPAAADPAAGPGPSVTIKDFYLTAATANLVGSAVGVSDRSVTLADIHLTDIGAGPDGVPMSEAARLIMDALAPQVAKAVASAQGKQLLDKAISRGEGAVGDVKDKAEEKLKRGLGGLLGDKPKPEGQN